MLVKFESETENPIGIFDVDPKEVFEKRGDVVIVDVRGADEFHGDLGHVPGSELITLDVLAEALPSMQKDKTYVFVCRSGARSSRAAAYAKSIGFDSVYNMAGGMLLWNEMGLEIGDE
ncbi:MAG: rhodanese-like domain-containing protein [Bdellovibrionia bacterium]